VPRFIALQAEWKRHPPAHWLVAAALKYKPPGDEAPPRGSSIAELKAAFPGGRL